MSDTQLALVESANPSAEAIVAPHPWMARVEDHPAWPILSAMPVVLRVQINLNRLKVRDLLRLDKGQLLESSWSQTSDVPVATGETRLCWGEFEVSGQRIGIRVTQLV